MRQKAFTIQYGESPPDKAQQAVGTQTWNRSREVRFKRSQGSARAAMRKREVIEPRKLREAEADAVYGAAGSNAKSIQQDFAGSAGVRERDERATGL